jgi:hypothetical protein
MSGDWRTRNWDAFGNAARVKHTATLAANVAHGLGYGTIRAVVAVGARSRLSDRKGFARRLGVGQTL